jgi:hypothetical protein
MARGMGNRSGGGARRGNNNGGYAGMFFGQGGPGGGGGGGNNGGGGGGNGGQVANSTSNTLPDYISGAYNWLMRNAKDEAKDDYNKYKGDFLAAEDPMVAQSYRNLQNFSGSNWDQGYDDATGIFGGIDARAQQLSGFQGQGVNYNGPAAYNPTNFTHQTVGNYNVNATPWNVNAQQINANPWNVNAQQIGNNNNVNANPWDVTAQQLNTNMGQINANPWDVKAQQVASQQWGADKADQYMNPYTTKVLDVQRNRAELENRQAQIGRNDAAVSRGAFGGSRHGVVDALARESHERNMADIDATGMNNAWNQALGAFAGDRDSALRAAMSNQGANLAAGQGNQATRLAAAQSNQMSARDIALANQRSALQAGQGNQATRLSAAQGNQNTWAAQQRANQAAALQAGQGNQDAMLNAARYNQDAALRAGQGNQSAMLSAAQGNQNYFLNSGIANQNANLEAQRLREQSQQYGYTQSMTQADRQLEAQRLSEQFRQSGADIALQGLDARNAAAAGIAGITGDRANMNLSMIDNMNRYGLQATARDQAQNDFDFQQWNTKQNWDRNQLNWYSGILNGVPVNTDTSQSTYVNPYSQALGYAGFGLQAYNTFSGNNNGGGPSSGGLW